MEIIHMKDLELGLQYFSVCIYICSHSYCFFLEFLSEFDVYLCSSKLSQIYPTINNHFKVIYVYRCFTCTVCAPLACNAFGGQQKVSGPLELKLQTVVSLAVGARNQAWVLWKSP